MKENPISFQLKLKPEDSLPATEEEKQSQVIMRGSVSFWKDGARRLRKNKVAMVSLVVIILVMIFSFIVPSKIATFVTSSRIALFVIYIPPKIDLKDFKIA